MSGHLFTKSSSINNFMFQNLGNFVSPSERRYWFIKVQAIFPVFNPPKKLRYFWNVEIDQRKFFCHETYLINLPLLKFIFQILVVFFFLLHAMYAKLNTFLLVHNPKYSLHFLSLRKKPTELFSCHDTDLLLC